MARKGQAKRGSLAYPDYNPFGLLTQGNEHMVA